MNSWNGRGLAPQSKLLIPKALPKVCKTVRDEWECRYLGWRTTISASGSEVLLSEPASVMSDTLQIHTHDEWKNRAKKRSLHASPCPRHYHRTRFARQD